MLRTEAQRKECRNCPVAKTADVIGDTPSLLIIRDLLRGPQRFCDMEKSIGISTRTLTLKLKRLEEEGFVRPHVQSTPYALTAKGKALSPTIESLRRFGEKYL
jgi:DNA-binding HxlR family transcriptional regulator